MTTLNFTTETIKGSKFNEEANILTLNRIPSIKEQNMLFSNSSIVLEF